MSLTENEILENTIDTCKTIRTEKLIVLFAYVNKVTGMYLYWLMSSCSAEKSLSAPKKVQSNSD